MARFLVLDDDDDALFLLQAQLQALGQQVDTTADFDEARRLLAAEPYAGLIVDVSMPGGRDGPSFVQTVRADGTEPEHVFLASALPVAEVQQLAAALGVTPLPKPFNRSTLQQVIEPALD